MFLPLNLVSGSHSDYRNYWAECIIVNVKFEFLFIEIPRRN